MKPDKLPLCTTGGTSLTTTTNNSTAIQNKLEQAQKEVKMLQSQQQQQFSSQTVLSSSTSSSVTSSSMQTTSLLSTSSNSAFQRVISSSSSSETNGKVEKICQTSSSENKICQSISSSSSTFNGSSHNSFIQQNGSSQSHSNGHFALEHSNGHSVNGQLGNGHLGNGHSGNGQLENGESLEHVISQGTETVRALTEALKRDDQRFSLPRDDKRTSLAEKSSQQQENNIAGSYFKTKYGNGDQNTKSETKKVGGDSSYRARSVGAFTPDRENRRPSFSYLSLLPADGSFPHRTQPIGGPQTSRKTSACNSSAGSRAPSAERATLEKSNLMVRSNPIGLAEPSVKRDGYAVGKDGSFYRSSENLFSNPPSRTGSRASSETPEVRAGRRTSDAGVRLGGGLVETGRPQVNHFSTPFGSTVGGKSTKNYTVKKGSSVSSTSNSSSRKTMTSSTSHLERTEERSSLSTKRSTLTSSVSCEESTVVNCTVQRGRHRSNSSCRATVTTLPDRDVTISLPGSLRASVDREIGIPDSGLARSGRSSSVEIFNGVYEMKVPRPPKAGTTTTKTGKTAEVEEIYSDHIILRGANNSSNSSNNLNLKSSQYETNEAPHTEVILTGIPLHRSALIKSDTPPRKVKESSTTNGSCSITTQTLTSSKLVMAQEMKMEHMKIEKLAQTERLYRAEQLQIENDKKKEEDKKREMEEKEKLERQRLERQKEEQRKLEEKQREEQKKIEKQKEEQKRIEMEKQREEQRIIEQKRLEKQKEEQRILEQQKLEKQRSEQKRMKEERERLEQQQQLEQRQTVVSGHKFNISTSLKKTSKMSSREDLSTTTTVVKQETKESSVRSNEVGGHLRGLNLALEALASKQQQQDKRSQLITSSSKQQQISTSTDGEVTIVTVSLPASRRSSRRGSVDLGVMPPTARRSRRNSLDLFTAEYDVKLSNRSGLATPVSMEQKNVCHIRIDDRENTLLKLCPRCHGVGHGVSDCTEYGDMTCPRCLDWNHWEDSCPNSDVICSTCNTVGHLPVVHGATDWKQRRMVVDTHGWEPFREWFYELSFRSWWQLNGIVGVPLYKIYRRKKEWRSEGPITDCPVSDEQDLETVKGTLTLEERAAVLAEKYSSTYSNRIKRDNSIDDLMKTINENKIKRRTEVVPAASTNDDDNDSGRSTPEYLKKYSVNYHFANRGKNTTSAETDGNDDDGVAVTTTTTSTTSASTQKRLRTFSETLKMLDDDILADLDVK